MSTSVSMESVRDDFSKPNIALLDLLIEGTPVPMDTMHRIWVSNAPDGHTPLASIQTSRTGLFASVLLL